MPAVPNLRVIVVEDHDVVRKELTSIVDGEPDMAVVAEAATAEQALELIHELAPDIVLMDVSIPGSNGVTLTEVVSRNHPGMCIIGVSRHAGPAVVGAMFRAGARGYVLKQGALSQLSSAIRAVAAGLEYVDPALRAEKAPRAPINGPSDPDLEPLTLEEEDVLRLVAFSCTHEEIAQRLGISVAQVMARKTAAMRKAHLSSRVHVLEYARRRGWLSKRSHRVVIHRHGADSSGR